VSAGERRGEGGVRLGAEEHEPHLANAVRVVARTVSTAIRAASAIGQP
jgi:hypothetical protein